MWFLLDYFPNVEHLGCFKRFANINSVMNNFIWILLHFISLEENCI